MQTIIYQFKEPSLESQILREIPEKWMEQNILGPRMILKDKNSIKVNKFPDGQSPVEAAFDCLSSIDSADNNDDVDEGEVLEVLQSNAGRTKGNQNEKLKNDDL